MANIKITDLQALNNPKNTDVLPIVDISADETKKVSIADLLENAGEGSVTNAAFAFDGDPNTGMYHPSDDVLGFTAGGTQALRVESTGVIVPGNLTVEGTTTLIETTNLVIEDKNIQLATVTTPTNTTADGGGITLKGATDKTITWVNSTGCWTFNQPIEVGGSQSSGVPALDLSTYNANVSTTSDVVLSSNGVIRAASSINNVVNASGYFTWNVGGTDDKTGTSGSSEMVRITSAGNFGIGTTSPASKLHLADTSTVITFEDTNSTNNSTNKITNYEGTMILSVDPNNNSTTTESLRFDMRGSEAMRIDSSGNLGIGTTNAYTPLTIRGTGSQLTLDLNSTTTNDYASIAWNGSTVDLGANASAEIRGIRTANGALGAIAFHTRGSGNTSDERMRIDSSGNFGIGESSPTGLLHIKGNSPFIKVSNTAETTSGLKFFDSADETNQNFTLTYNSGTGNGVDFDTYPSGASYAYKFSHAGNTRLLIDASGNCGIGITTVRDKTHIYGDGQTTANIADSGTRGCFLRLSQSGASAGTGGGILFANEQGDTANSVGFAAIKGLLTNGDGNTKGALAFSVRNSTTDTSLQEAMRIDASGNCAIGTTSPVSLLTVSKTVASGEGGVLAIQNTGSGVGTSAVLYLVPNNGGGNDLQRAASVKSRQSTSGNYADLGFFTSHSDTPVERLTITSAGNCGIATTNPTELLTLGNAGTAGADNYIRINSSNNSEAGIKFYGDQSGAKGYTTGYEGDGNLFFIRSDSSGTVTDRLVINDSGNCGIGTTSPSEKLEVDGKVKINASAGPAQLYLAQAGTTNGLISAAGGGGTDLTLQAGRFLSLDSVNSTVFNSISAIGGTATEQMRVDSSGRLLVSTSSAIASVNNSGGNALCLNGSQTFFRSSSDTNSQYIEFVKQRASGTVVSSGDKLGQILFEGHDGSNPIKAAEITSLVDGTPGTDDMPGRLVFSTTADGASSPTERMRISASGHLYLHTTSNFPGSGNTATGAMFEKAGDGTSLFVSRDNNVAAHINRNSNGASVHFRRSGNQVGFISVTTTSTTYSTTSDYRLKENVVDIADGITRVKQLAPKRFNFIADADTTVDGFLAHEAQTVVPEAVTGTHNEVDDNGDAVMQGIDQSKLVPLLTAALQEAIAKIETLEQRLTDAGL